jgi:membrane associated rhomboid family serine protease
MSSGADLFVVCKQCGSEVSSYVTECPYCGHRLRRRAPKLPRENVPSRAPRGLSRRIRWRRPTSPTPALARPRGRLSRWAQESKAGSRPYATIALVAVSCAAWVAWRGGFVGLDKLVVAGPLHGDWWKLFTSQFAYQNGLYGFVTLVAVAIFGWLLELRRGPAVVLALFLGAGATGALLASAVYSEPTVSGGSAAALALLAAWAVPDLRAARAGSYYEGDLLGAGAIAAVLLAIPFALPKALVLLALPKALVLVALPETSWLAGVTGGALGLLVGLGLQRVESPEL